MGSCHDGHDDVGTPVATVDCSSDGRADVILLSLLKSTVAIDRLTSAHSALLDRKCNLHSVYKRKHNLHIVSERKHNLHLIIYIMFNKS
jgi:hypothetical protein